jgi:hypothetical protein
MNEQVEAIFGVARPGVMSTLGIPWLLMSEKPLKHKQLFEKYTPGVIEYWQSLFDRMENYVDADNEVALRWLNRIGFTVDKEPVPYGVMQAPFYRFEWRKNV